MVEDLVFNSHITSQDAHAQPPIPEQGPVRRHSAPALGTPPADPPSRGGITEISQHPQHVLI